jgi:hypothetical protein
MMPSGATCYIRCGLIHEVLREEVFSESRIKGFLRSLERKEVLLALDAKCGARKCAHLGSHSAACSISTRSLNGAFAAAVSPHHPRV